jgi:hypothetical protein
VAPVRLKVAYKNPEALLGELTRSVGRGGVRIESHRALEVGTRFIFELKAIDLHQPVEVQGTVMSVSDSGKGTYVLHIRYEPPTNRQGLDALLSRIFNVAKADAKRKHARIPLQVRAVGETPESPTFRLRDISKGGVGIDIESETMPNQIAVGTPFLMLMRLTSGQLALHGEVVWVVSSKSDGLPLRAGVAFGTLAPKMLGLLDELLALKALSPPPWIARVVFGAGAVSAVPSVEH